MTVDNGADLDAKSYEGQTSLHQAARSNAFDIAKVSNAVL